MSFTVVRDRAISVTACLFLLGCNGFIGQLSLDRIKQGQGVADKQHATGQAPQQSAGAPANQTVGVPVFSVGEQWVYAITIESPAGTLSGETTRKVISVDGDQVTIESTTALAGNEPITANKAVRLDGADPYKDLVLDGSMVVGAPVVTDESVTVPAGSFQAQKAAYVGTKDGAEMIVNAWATEKLGVIKYDIVTKVAAPTLPSQLPAGMGGMAGGALSNLTTKTVVELKSHTK